MLTLMSPINTGIGPVIKDEPHKLNWTDLDNLHIEHLESNRALGRDSRGQSMRSGGFASPRVRPDPIARVQGQSVVAKHPNTAASGFQGRGTDESTATAAGN